MALTSRAFPFHPFLIFLSKLASILFGVGLVSAGQSSTVTGTMAGQIVMEVKI
jgi:Mn2+/Fe2+ NRAMP family transporter